MIDIFEQIVKDDKKPEKADLEKLFKAKGIDEPVDTKHHALYWNTLSNDILIGQSIKDP